MKNKTMKILTIYCLNSLPLDESELDRLKVVSKVDVVLQISADNQLDGIQYPYLVIENLE